MSGNGGSGCLLARAARSCAENSASNGGSPEMKMRLPCLTQRLKVAPASGTSALMTCLCIVFSRTLLWCAIPTGRRRLNDDRLASIDHGGVGAFEPLHAAVVPAHP